MYDDDMTVVITVTLSHSHSLSLSLPFYFISDLSDDDFVLFKTVPYLCFLSTDAGGDATYVIVLCHRVSFFFSFGLTANNLLIIN